MGTPALASPATGTVLLNLVDGTRQPLPANVQWSVKLMDGQTPSVRKTYDFSGSGSVELVKGLPFFDNLFDNYTVVVSANGYADAGWMPVTISPKRVAIVNLFLVPKDGHCNFAAAFWTRLQSVRPQLFQILSNGAKDKNDAQTRYEKIMEDNEGLALAALLNITAAMSQITLPSGKTPLDYYWELIWDSKDFALAPDRFFGYADKALIDDVVQAAATGGFAEEKDPGIFHPGATLSYKQTQFDVTNVQLTFHQGNQKSVQLPNGSSVDCVVVEPDIDFYKDPLAHFFLEVIPNKVTSGLTDPREVQMLRWMAGKQAGLPDFDPLYTIEA
ncbi:MAG: carboxypeptidase-like regulatory domain-containing protein [Acidobacteriia bacterium]|nr:carboxypeptidase-like regulatory domain-containing protein [Terriglobia bacterium]